MGQEFTFNALTGKLDLISVEAIPSETDPLSLHLDQTTPQTVTGRPTFPALTVDTNTLYVDSVNHRVGVGTNIPTQPLTVSGAGMFGVGNASEVLLGLDGNAAGHEGISIHHDGDSGWIKCIDAGTAWQGIIVDALNFQVKIADSEKMRVTSTGVGIGTSAPSTALEVVGVITNTDLSAQLYFRGN